MNVMEGEFDRKCAEFSGCGGSLKIVAKELKKYDAVLRWL